MSQPFAGKQTTASGPPGAPPAPLFSIVSGTETMAAFGKLLDAHCSEGETLWRRGEAQKQRRDLRTHHRAMSMPCLTAGIKSGSIQYALSPVGEQQKF